MEHVLDAQEERSWIDQEVERFAERQSSTPPFYAAGSELLTEESACKVVLIEQRVFRSKMKRMVRRQTVTLTWSVEKHA